MRQRAEAISTALRMSAINLRQATRLISDHQQELSNRLIALDDLRQQIADSGPG
jgi:hypothetical protein